MRVMFERELSAPVPALGVEARGRRVISVPTQEGCVVGCGFCPSGGMRSARNLLAEDMGERVRRAWEAMGPWSGPCELSFGGEGEPLMNWRECERLRADAASLAGVEFDSSRYCFSGWGSRLLEGLAPSRKGQALRLQWSLHSPRDEVRARLIRKVEPIEKTLESIRRVQGAVDEVALNVALMEGVNDSDEDVELLARLGDPHWVIVLSALMAPEGAKIHQRAREIEGRLRERGRRARRLEAVAKSICSQGAFARLASNVA
jgi:adenine C2-methylase RlmN of 23S rRNA A2503 and tRNA A37